MKRKEKRHWRVQKKLKTEFMIVAKRYQRGENINIIHNDSEAAFELHTESFRNNSETKVSKMKETLYMLSLSVAQIGFAISLCPPR